MMEIVTFFTGLSLAMPINHGPPLNILTILKQSYHIEISNDFNNIFTNSTYTSQAKATQKSAHRLSTTQPTKHHSIKTATQRPSTSQPLKHKSAL